MKSFIYDSKGTTFVTIFVFLHLTKKHYRICLSVSENTKKNGYLSNIRKWLLLIFVFFWYKDCLSSKSNICAHQCHYYHGCGFSVTLYSICLIWVLIISVMKIAHVTLFNHLCVKYDIKHIFVVVCSKLGL